MYERALWEDEVVVSFNERALWSIEGWPILGIFKASIRVLDTVIFDLTI